MAQRAQSPPFVIGSSFISHASIQLSKSTKSRWKRRTESQCLFINWHSKSMPFQTWFYQSYFRELQEDEAVRFVNEQTGRLAFERKYMTVERFMEEIQRNPVISGRFFKAFLGTFSYYQRNYKNLVNSFFDKLLKAFFKWERMLILVDQ